MTIPVLGGYIAPYKPVSNITPFTYRDGLTYLEILENLRGYVNTTLVDFVNTNFTSLGDDFETQVNQLITTINSDTDIKLDDVITQLNDAVTAITNSTITITDPVVTGLAEDSTTQFSQYMGSAFAAKTTKQAWLYAQALNKLKTNLPVSIVIRGDSLVYGQDAYSSDKVAAPADVLPDGSVNTITRSPSPYPTVLQSRLREVYGANVTVINQGYSGDWVQRSYDRWLNNVGASLTFYQFGINDANATGVPVDIRGNLEAYIESLEKMLLRDLSWGSAVVFMTATKQRDWMGTTNLEVYRNALFSLAERYGVPVIDAEPFMANYGPDCYSDGNHFNTKGYNIFGTRLAATLIGNGPHKPAYVDSGSTIATRPTIDNCVYVNSIMYGNGGGGSPDNGSGYSGVALPATLNTDGFVYHSFYTETADTLVVPMVYMLTDGTGVAEWDASLDFGIEQPDNTQDHVVGYATSLTTREPSTITTQTISGSTSDFNFLEAGGPQTSKTTTTLKAIRIVTPGWHTLKVRLKRTSATVLSHLNGLHFLNFREFYLQEQFDAIKSADTGWVNVTVSPGYTAIAGNAPQVRKIGNVVYTRGGWTNAAMVINTAYNVGVIPAGFIATTGINIALGSSSGESSAILSIGTDGVAQIRTGNTLATYYNISGNSWLTD